MASFSSRSAALYRKHKKNRRLLQESVYLGLRAEHPVVWIAVMHLMWPERVPKVVWAQLAPQERAQWRVYRELGRFQRLLDAHPVTNSEQAVNRLNRLGQLTEAIHGAAVNALVALLRHQVTVGRVTLFYQAFGITGPSSSPPAQLITREDVNDEASWDAFEPILRRGLALGLTYGGSVVVRQPIGLRVAAEASSARWRMAGIGLMAGGQWRHLSAQEMAQADAGTPTDEAVGVSYGTLEPPAQGAQVLTFPGARRRAQ